MGKVLLLVVVYPYNSIVYIGPSRSRVSDRTEPPRARA